jgi:glycosyltransferase involved in cell wall biosynthesis
MIGPAKPGVTSDPTAGRMEEGATPDAWRVAALAILGGGALAGYLAGRGKLGGAVTALTAGVALGCVVPIALAGRRPPITPEGAEEALRETAEPPTFSVLVGARDEAGVLPALVADVAGQDYRDDAGRPRFELVVVDDRSFDGSGEVVLRTAREAGIGAVTRVVRREGAGLPDGKGAALTAAQPDSCRGDVVVVLDADARIQPWFLRRAAGYFAAGARAVTARRMILDAESSWLAGAQADEQTLDGEINRGRWAMGGCSEFRGNGIMIRRDLLAEVGGWRAEALTEDIDLSSRIAAGAGERVAWAVDVEVWEEPVRSVEDLWRQRLRWAEGAFRRLFDHGRAVVSSQRLSVRSRLDFAGYVGQLAVPTVVAGAAAGAVRGRRRPLLAVLAGYLGVSAALGWDSLRWARDADGTPPAGRARLWRALRVALFGGLWLLAVPGALLRLAVGGGPIRYQKMEHGNPDENLGRGGRARHASAR